jgi:acetyl esterase/lipase
MVSDAMSRNHAPSRALAWFAPLLAACVRHAPAPLAQHEPSDPVLVPRSDVGAARGPVKELEPIPLWRDAAPGSGQLALEEKITERSSDPSKPDRIVTGITRPSLTIFAPAHADGAALIVASGGGYVREVLDKEGSEVARWFAPRGVTVFLLKYRLPGEGHEDGKDVPLQDAQRAVRIARSRASQFGVDPSRIGVMGFSAGGHLAASIGARFADKVYEPTDEIDAVSARPDYVILLYPVISMEEGLAHGNSRRALLGDKPSAAAMAAYSADTRVGPTAPPTLLILADDDPSVLPENSLRYYEALHRAGVPAELHIYRQGKHGFGIRAARGMPVAEWPEVAWNFMAAGGIVQKDGG